MGQKLSQSKNIWIILGLFLGGIGLAIFMGVIAPNPSSESLPTLATYKETLREAGVEALVQIDAIESTPDGVAMPLTNHWQDYTQAQKESLANSLGERLRDHLGEEVRLILYLDGSIVGISTHHSTIID